MRDLRNRLQDILEAIAQIEVEPRKGKAAFAGSPLIQVWMVYHLMIIGEAVRSIDPTPAALPVGPVAPDRRDEKHPGDDYFRINQALIWETVDKGVPALKTEIERILGELPLV